MQSGRFKGPHVVLYRPQIPPNTGNISRLCVGIHARLTIAGNPGFVIDDKTLKRAGLDHWQDLDFHHHRRFKDFIVKETAGDFSDLVALTKTAPVSIYDFRFRPEQILLFGNETAGLPPALLKKIKHKVRIPMPGPVRSLNLSNAVAITAYEFLRQQGLFDDSDNDSIRSRTFYKPVKDPETPGSH